jgi:hypothetical protein
MNESRLRLVLRGAVALAICSPALAASCGGSVAPVDDAGASSTSSSGGSSGSSSGSTSGSSSGSSSGSTSGSSSGSSSGSFDASLDCGAPAELPDANVCTYYVPVPCDFVWDGGGIASDQCRSLCDPADAGLSPVFFCNVLKLDNGQSVQCNTCVVGRLQDGYAIATTEAPNALTAHFAITAELEAASVHAFERLAAELEAHGAPATLSARARRAARDEIRHARVMRSFARRHGGHPVTPRRAPAPVRTLEEIARENAVEGCVRETYGAAVATFQAEHAADPELRAAMARIADDETRHAALGWDVAAWAREQLCRDANARVDREMGRAVDALARAVGRGAAPELSEAGLPDAGTSARIFGALRASLWSRGRGA